MTTWTVEITDTNGTTYTPDVLAGARRVPQVNGRPRVEIPVPYREQSDGTSLWFGDEFDGADMSVTRSGSKQPVTTLVDVTNDQRGIVLVGRGGDELDERVEKEFGVLPTHEAAGQIIDETSYNKDVPTPSTTTDTGVTVQDTTTLAETDLAEPLAETDPLSFASGDLALQESLTFTDHADETFDTAGQSFTAISGASFSYRIPDDAVAVGLLVQSVSSATEIIAEVGGQEVGRIDAGTSYGSDQWVHLTARPDALAAGESNDVVLRVPNDSSLVNDATTVEATALYDDRYSYTFDASLSTTPETYPDAVRRGFAAPALTRAVTAAEVSTAANSVQGLRLESGNGEEVGSSSSSPTASFSYTFNQRWATVRFVVELGRSGSQTLTGYTLSADLEDMPLVVRESYEGRIASILTELTSVIGGDFAWALRLDSNDNQEVGFIRRGEETGSELGRLVDYSFDRDIDAQRDQWTVRGGIQQVLGEVTRVSHGTAAQLAERNLLDDSERVVDADGTEYARGDDYTMDYATGSITALSGGDLPDGARVAVDYRWRPRATVTRSGVSSPQRTETVTFARLREDRECSLAAQQLLRATAEPIYRATTTLSGPVFFEVTQTFSSTAWPVDTELQPTTIESGEGRSVIRLDSRESTSEVISEVRARLGSIESEVVTGAERKGGFEGEAGGGDTIRTTQTGVDVEDGSTTVVPAASAVSAGVGLVARDDGDGTATVDAIGGGSATGAAVGAESATTSVPGDGSLTTVDFDTVVWDTESNADTSTDTITVPVDGRYRIRFTAAFSDGPSGFYAGYVVDGDGNYLAAWSSHGNNADPVSVGGSRTLDLTAGTTLEVQVQQDSGSSIDLSTGVRNVNFEVVGVANAAGGVDIEQDGSTLVEGATAINAGSGITATDDGDGTATLTASGGGVDAEQAKLIKTSDVTVQDSGSDATWDDVLFDAGNNVDLSANSYIAPASGVYHVSIKYGLLHSSADEKFQVYLSVNDNTVGRAYRSFADSGGVEHIVLSETIEVSSGDAIKGELWNYSGNSVDILSDNDNTQVSVYRIG